MSKIRFFQMLVVVVWLLQLLLNTLAFLAWYVDPILGKLIALDGYDAIVDSRNSIFYDFPLWAFLFASVGMFFFQNWGRYLYIVLWLYAWVVTLLFGVRVTLPVESFIGMAIGTLDGMILYLAFLSELRLEFRTKK